MGQDSRGAMGNQGRPRRRQHAGSTDQSVLPTPLTPLVGRTRELTALAGAILDHRLVTATGPGGVGKTRLGLAVAGSLAGEFADGVAWVDLVALTDDGMVVDAIADAVGVPDGTGARLSAIAWALRDRRCLLVIDNCEHLLAGVRGAVAELLAACPLLRVLATSRTRLLLAGETVFPVPGLSLVNGSRDGDAVELFTTRLAASGMTGPLDDDDLSMIRSICALVDGLALAIEIAAARAPTFGVGALRESLTQSHELLTYAHPGDDRHGSLRAALDWSYQLLSADEQQVLRAVAVFASSFDLDAACAVTACPAERLVSLLGALVDGSLLTLRPGARSRYRVLETIRQYGAERAAQLGELDELWARHVVWCRAVLTQLLARAPEQLTWCADADDVLDDARAALGRAVADPGRVGDAAQLAELIGSTAFLRGRPGEAQLRYEQAADLSANDERSHVWLHLAARAALTRYAGDEAVALAERATAAALEDHDDESGARYLAESVIWRHRHTGTMSEVLTGDATDALLARARQLGAGSARVEVAVAVAQASRNDDPRSLAVALDAVERAGTLDDALLVDAALDQVCGAQLELGDLEAASATVRTRLDAMAHVPIDVQSGMDHSDAHLMAAHVELASGRLTSARRHADALAALPFLREEPHVGLARRLEVSALAGQFDDVVTQAEIFRTAWVRAGRRRANTLGSSAYAVAMVFGMLYDQARREAWIGITQAVSRTPDVVRDDSVVWPAALDALLSLEIGEPDRALARLRFAPDEVPAGLRWQQHLWLPWYAAAWAEASALTDAPDRAQRLQRAARAASGNEIAQLVIERSAEPAHTDPARLAIIAARFDELGCPYQARRTRSQRLPPPVSRVAGTLSPREREVLRLVATGLTNPQIAAALYISSKTAEHHVSNILTKLGTSNRAQAAALAIQLNLDQS